MPNLSTISLNDQWVSYIDHVTPVSGFVDGSAFVPSLRQWISEGESVRLERKFSLEPMDEICVSYFLHVLEAPLTAQITINGRVLAAYVKPFEMDVTDYVWLEDNVIAIYVSGAAPGKFGDVYLQPVPCDQL